MSCKIYSSIPIIDSIHLTSIVLLLLTLYAISCILSLVFDFGSNLSELHNCSLALQIISYLIFIFPIYNIGVVIISKYYNRVTCYNTNALKESFHYMLCFLVSSFVYFVITYIIWPFQSTRDVRLENVIVPL
jgi:hypothetical protein